MKKKIILIISIIIIAGLGLYFFLIKGNYQWDSLKDKAQYANVSWNKITNSSLDGFTPRVTLSENKTEPCRAFDNNNTYLRSEGGMCQTGFWLEVKNGTITKKIDSVAKLKETFGPVDSEAEAVSFVVVTTSDLKINADGIAEGRTATIEDGFLVQVVRNNTFGCGNHQPTGVIYKVLKSGDIQQVAAEKKPSFGFGPQMCVD